MQGWEWDAPETHGRARCPKASLRQLEREKRILTKRIEKRKGSGKKHREEALARVKQAIAALKPQHGHVVDFSDIRQIMQSNPQGPTDGYFIQMR